MVSIFQRQIPIFVKRQFSSSSSVSSWIFSNVSLATEFLGINWKIDFYLQEASKSTGHSSLLADKNEVYEVLVEDVSPRYWDDYLAHKADFMPLLEAKTQNHCELIASWRFIHGDVNFRAMHLFKYSNVRITVIFSLSNGTLLFDESFIMSVRLYRLRSSASTRTSMGS